MMSLRQAIMIVVGLMFGSLLFTLLVLLIAEVGS